MAAAGWLQTSRINLLFQVVTSSALPASHLILPSIQCLPPARAWGEVGAGRVCICFSPLRLRFGRAWRPASAPWSTDEETEAQGRSVRGCSGRWAQSRASPGSPAAGGPQLSGRGLSPIPGGLAAARTPPALSLPPSPTRREEPLKVGRSLTPTPARAGNPTPEAHLPPSCPPPEAAASGCGAVIVRG